MSTRLRKELLMLGFILPWEQWWNWISLITGEIMIDKILGWINSITGKSV